MKSEKEALAAVKLIRNSLGQPIFDSKVQKMRALQLRRIPLSSFMDPELCRPLPTVFTLERQKISSNTSNFPNCH